MDDETERSQLRASSLAITDWKHGVAPLLADLSTYQAYQCEHVFRTVNAIRSGEIRITSENIPNLKIWFSYYQSHKRLILDVAEFFTPLLKYVPHGLRPQEILSGNGSRPEATDILSFLQARTLKSNPGLNNLDLDWHNSPPALLFFILIWVPCNCLWGENPPELLFRARHGDLSAARKLIQLDKSIIFEPGIARKMRQWTAEGRADKVAEIGSYLGEPIPDVSLQQVKLTWARFILDTSLRAGQRMLAPKIQELFNAIAQDSGHGLQDPDVGDMSPEAFAKALTRRVDFWKLSPSR
ncbi:hypothetical protein LF599_02500 [Pseudodesulfovibrio thermohalotolerans]|uniref:hypothetical protein n=1 Tax=Pseudodesulfovibrio thermohalotolerans TaxID=2880651 RepID=UPI0022B9FF0B|nr:hypothetical protein [Pseudodesulfovibrio thermohalotolerans]WFS63047.1 hypothetical protein LF599_02500 [Pseudodesulfovibrio thermohalotolerans]